MTMLDTSIVEKFRFSNWSAKKLRTIKLKLVDFIDVTQTYLEPYLQFTKYFRLLQGPEFDIILD